MKTVVITGSARGFGFALASDFRRNNFNVVLSDLKEENLKEAKTTIEKIESEGKVETVVCDVTKSDNLENLWQRAVSTFGQVDIWINNAGVNQPDLPVCMLTEKDIDFLLNIDLKGAINGSRIAFAHMVEQGYGQIYNVEGYGSNDAMKTGLTIYGTAKRAITYFTEALAKESESHYNDKVLVNRLTPGIMITNFLTEANGGATKVELPEKIKKVYNILGDYPETISAYVVPRMIKNKKNNSKVAWLTTGRAFRKFMSAPFKKRDFFNK
ncbi:MAG: SDR family oxidoreductase [Clostridia bacterium]|nr:SDR family oxidoreductase [Clostridia bacterium]